MWSLPIRTDHCVLNRGQLIADGTVDEIRNKTRRCKGLSGRRAPLFKAQENAHA